MTWNDADTGPIDMGPGHPEPAGPAPRKAWPSWLGLILNVVAALVVVALVQAFLVKVYSVPSGSMEQTLNVGDRIVANRLAYVWDGPGAGDVVVFRAGEGWEGEFLEAEQSALEKAVRMVGDATGIGPSNEKFLVKRVVGVGGDTVECCTADGSLLRNGQPVQEDYLYEDLAFAPGELDCASRTVSFRCFGPVEVPQGKVLVLGDHRAVSSDGVVGCRGRGEDSQPACARFVGEPDIVGRVWLKIWPPTDWRSF